MDSLPRNRALWVAAILAGGGMTCAWTTCAWTSAGMAQTLPATGGSGSGSGATVQTGSLGSQIAAALPVAGGGGLGWQVTPAIGVQEQWTDNAFPGIGSPQASFITVVTPSLAVSGDSARLTGNLLYAPSVYYYSNVSGQNQVAQNLSTSWHVTLAPDQLFIDLQGFAAEQAINPGTAPQGTTAISQQNLAQSYSFSASPYLTHRFGGLGTAQIGAMLSDTSQSALAGSLPGINGGSQTLQTTQETASFTSGEDFGRLFSSLQLSASQESGSGVLQGATNNTATYQAGYAITHSIQALASIGWEDIAYGNPYGATTGAVHINDATWSVGTKLQPNPDSSITLLYGHQQGVTAASLNASYAPTARTQVFASYADGISTAAEQLQSSLAGAQFDALGHPVSAQTGAPLQLTNNFFGIPGAVFRLRTYSLTAAWQLDRNSVQATVNRQETTPVGGQPVGLAPTLASTGTYGSLAWQHDLSDALQSSLFVQYGVTDIGSGAARISSNLVVVSASLNYAFSSTLTGSAQYSYTSNPYAGIPQAGIPQAGAGQTSSAAVNLVVLGLRKTF